MKYSELAALYDVLEGTSKRLEMTWHIAKFLVWAEEQNLKQLVLLLQGRVFPPWDERKVGVAEKIVMKAMAKATQSSMAAIEKGWGKTGDLGKVAEEFSSNETKTDLSAWGGGSAEELTVQRVFTDMQQLAELEGKGSVDDKISIITALLTSASASEAKYITRTALEQLRLGVGEGTLRDAIAWAFLPKVMGILIPCGCGSLMPAMSKCISCGEKLPKKFPDIVKAAEQFAQKNNHTIISGGELLTALKGEKELEDNVLVVAENDTEARELYNALIEVVQHAYDVTNDFGKVAKDAKVKRIAGLLEMTLEVGIPVKVMLAIKEDSIAKALKRVGSPAAAEYKLDGFRMQVHKDGDSVRIFTRGLEEVTIQFPEIVEVVNEKIRAESVMLDCEAVGFDPKTKKYLAFQGVSQRIRRKYGIEEMSKEFPVQLNVFDVLLLDGKTVLKEPFEARRKLIERIVPMKGTYLRLTPQIVGDSEERFADFFKEAMQAGHEGIMFKRLDAEYKPGARVGHMVKYKEVMEGLDLAIVKAERGEGKRAGWLTSFTLACRGPDGKLLEIGKVGTGLKEKREEGLSFEEMTELLTPHMEDSGKVVDVKPKIVVEVHYEEIQKSPNYSSGYALRFPRIIRLRQDKGINDISTLELIETFYTQQRNRS